MKRKVSMLITVFVMLLAFGITANAEGLTISKNKVTVNVGGTVTLETSGTDKTPVWTSYNTNLVRVNQRGQVTGLKTGKTTIKVRAGKESRTCAVTVVAPSLKLNKKAATIYHGGTSAASVQLKATTKGASKEVQWSSSNESVATVNEKGLVTAKKAGWTVITAEANGRKASCNVWVRKSSITLNMDSLQLSTRGAGSSIKVTPTVVGSKKTVKWTTSDKSVATVSKGKITGKKQGTAVITATANGVSASCEVTVKEGLVSISEEKVILYSNTAKPETKQLKTNAGKKDTVTWTSSDESVATVNNKGLVTAKGAGTAVISVECNGTTDSCEVTVEETSVTLSDYEIYISTKGTERTYLLEADVVGRKASVKWSSSNPKVATVSKGKVVGKKEGRATIMAEANGVYDRVAVYVLEPGPTVKLNADRYTLYTGKGSTVTLKAAVDGANKKVTWSSSDESVVTVNSKGKVTAKGSGRAVITAEANGVSDTCVVTVKESSVSLSSTYLKLDAGDKVTITADVTGAGQSVKWTSTNSRVASVKNGVITAKKDGEADIRATANGVTSICHVLVDSDACSHSYDGGIVTRKPNCTDTGIMTYTCTVCGDNYNVDIPVVEDHDYESKVEDEPTCVLDGSMLYTCKLCGHSYDEVIPATGHNCVWKDVVAASCEKDGSRTQVCSVCGYCGREEVVPATGHNWGEWVVTKEATESAAGVETRTCSVCGKTEENEIPVVPGTEEPGVEEPGTEEPGTEEPGTEEPGTEEPGTDEPCTEEPGTGDGQGEGETEDPIAVRICKCGHFMKIYTPGLSNEEDVRWDEHSDVHLARGEWNSYTAVSWERWCYLMKYAYKGEDPYRDCTCAICKEMSEETPTESDETQESEETETSDDTQVSEEIGTTDGTDTPGETEAPEETETSEETGTTDGTDASGDAEEPEPVMVRVCQCGHVMMIYADELSPEEVAAWDAHIEEDQAKGQYNCDYDLTYAEYLEYLERIS